VDRQYRQRWIAIVRVSTVKDGAAKNDSCLTSRRNEPAQPVTEDVMLVTEAGGTIDRQRRFFDDVGASIRVDIDKTRDRRRTGHANA